MYVCMQLCMHAGYVCAYVCMNECMYVWPCMCVATYEHTVIINGYRKADWHAEVVRYRLNLDNEGGNIFAICVWHEAYAVRRLNRKLAFCKLS